VKLNGAELVGGTDLGSVDLTSNEDLGCVELTGAHKATPHEPHGAGRRRAEGKVRQAR